MILLWWPWSLLRGSSGADQRGTGCDVVRGAGGAPMGDQLPVDGLRGEGDRAASAAEHGVGLKRDGVRLWVGVGSQYEAHGSMEVGDHGVDRVRAVADRLSGGAVEAKHGLVDEFGDGGDDQDWCDHCGHELDLAANDGCPGGEVEQLGVGFVEGDGGDGVSVATAESESCPPANGVAERWRLAD